MVAAEGEEDSELRFYTRWLREIKDSEHFRKDTFIGKMHLAFTQSYI